MWLTEEAQRLEDDGLHDDPLIKPEQKVKMLQEYNKVEKELLRYRRTQLVKEYPGLRDAYKTLGWEFDEPAESIPEERPEPAQELKVDYAAFLDD